MVVPELNLLDASIAFSKQLSNGPTNALKEIKKIADNTVMYGIKKADTEAEKSIKNVLKSSDRNHCAASKDSKKLQLEFAETVKVMCS